MRRLVLVLALLLALYSFLVRPRLLRWGATREEVAADYPGRDLIPGGTRSGTMAVTIHAPPAKVWPWLLQMGYGRGGWYSWDHLDNWGASSAHELHGEWQQVRVGDRLPSMPDNAAWWEVAALEPERFLGLRASMNLNGQPFDPAEGRPRFYTDSLWAFQLNESPGGRTRLVVSGYWSMNPGWARPLVSFFFLEPAHWVMQVRQFANLKRLVESEASNPSRTSGPA